MWKKLYLLVSIFILIFSFSVQATKNKWDFNKDSWTEIMKASYIGDINEIENLIKSGKDVNERISGGNVFTALDVAIRVQNYKVVKYLLREGAKVEVQGSSFEQPLIIASRGKDADIVDILLKYGADINKNFNGWTALKEAASRGSLKVLQTLINNGAYLENLNVKKGNSPLVLAVYDGSVEKVSALLNAGANPSYKNNQGETASIINEQLLEWSITEKREDMIEKREKIKDLLINREKEKNEKRTGSTLDSDIIKDAYR